MKFLAFGRRLRTLLVLAPLLLLVVLAIATGGLSSASAVFCSYGLGGCEGVPQAPEFGYGISDQLLYVANGRASDVAIIDVGTMSIVDRVPVPNQPAPPNINAWQPGLMNWEIHGAVPSRAVDGKRQYVYAVGALSGGSYDQAGNFRLADYQMYKVDVGTKAAVQEIPLQGPGAPFNPVGFCGLEYNLNDENSSEIVAANMNTTNFILSQMLHDPVTGAPIDLGGVRGSGWAETGGLNTVDISTGSYTGFINTDANSNIEASTCGIAWNATGDRAFASMQFETQMEKINWTTRAAYGYTGFIPGASLYHQAASDKAAGRYYVASSSGYVYIYDMTNDMNVTVGAIDIRALTGTTMDDIHGVEVAPGNPNVIYVTSRNTGWVGDNMELVVDVSNLSAPLLIGAIDGLATDVCGVYAIADKSEYYKAANPTGVGNEMLFVANGRASDVKVIDVGKMSIVDSVPFPNQPTPAGIHSWNPDIMNWEIHGAIPSKDRTSVYAVGALSGGSYAGAPLYDESNFRLADYEMYQVNTATKALEREIPLQGPGAPINPVGFCGLEYNLNDENSNEVVAANMNSANFVLSQILFDPVTGAPIDLGGVRGSGQAVENGGLTTVDIATGSYTGFISTDYNGSLESSTCGIAWNLNGDRAFASQQFEPLVDKINWTTRTTDGEIPAFAIPGLMHQSASDKARGRYYATSSSGYVYVYDMGTDAEVGAIDIRALTGSFSNDIHGVEVSPSDSNVIYVTSRDAPDPTSNTNTMEVVIDVTDLMAPRVLGSINGLGRGACGVYAIANKAEYYGTQPALSISKTHVYWGSYADYEARNLSVDYSIGNTGAAAARNVAIVGTTNTGGVTTTTALPLSAGNIGSGASSVITVNYHVPVGVAGFNTTNYATAQNGATIFSYPGPYPGA